MGEYVDVHNQMVIGVTKKSAELMVKWLQRMWRKMEYITDGEEEREQREVEVRILSVIREGVAKSTRGQSKFLERRMGLVSKSGQPYTKC